MTTAASSLPAASVIDTRNIQEQEQQTMCNWNNNVRLAASTKQNGAKIIMQEENNNHFATEITTTIGSSNGSKLRWIFCNAIISSTTAAVVVSVVVTKAAAVMASTMLKNGDKMKIKKLPCCSSHHLLRQRRKLMIITTMSILFMIITTVHGFGLQQQQQSLVSSSFGARKNQIGGHRPIVNNEVRNTAAFAITSGQQQHQPMSLFGNVVSSSSTALYATSDSNNNDHNNNNNNEDSSSQQNPLQLIQQWLLLHLPTLSTSDLLLYSTQLYQDGIDSITKLEGINNIGGGEVSGKLEDLYFMKKGHRRVLLQKLGKVREMKSNLANRLYKEEEKEEEESVAVAVGGRGVDKDEEEKFVVGERLEIDDNEQDGMTTDDDKASRVDPPSSSSSSSLSSLNQETTKTSTQPLINSPGLSMQTNNDDDSLIQLTAWENKQLQDFVYNEQERDAMDDKSKRRLKEIEEYLRDHRNRNVKAGGEGQEGEGKMMEGGDDYDMTTFEKKGLEEFVYNEQEREAKDDKGRRRLKEIQAYIKDQQRLRRERELEEGDNNDGKDNNVEDEGVSLSSPSLPASWNFQDLEDFVYNEQEREAKDDKGKRRLKEIEEYVRSEQQRIRDEMSRRYDSDEYDMEDEEELVDDFATRYDGIVTARDGKVVEGSVSIGSRAKKEERRLQEFREAWLARQRKAAGGGSNEDDEALLDDFASRYQVLGTSTADGVSGGRSEKSSRRLKELDAFLRARQARQSKGLRDEGDTPLDDLEARYQAIGSSAADTAVDADKSSRRLKELDAFLRARQARQSKGLRDEGDTPLDDLEARYQAIGSSAADTAVDADKSSRRLKELDAFLRARQARQSRGLRNEEDTPLDDLEARYQAIGSSAADTAATSRSDKSNRRLRALDAFLKSRQSRANAAAEKEALRLELLKKPLKDLTATERKERIRVEQFQRRARLAEEKEGRLPDGSGSKINAARRRKSNEERRLEALNQWRSKQNELVEMRRVTKLLKEEERLQEMDKANDRSPPLAPPFEETASIDDFFEKRKIQSLSTTLPPSNVGRRPPEMKSRPKADDEDCEGDECVDITRSAFSDRESRSLSTTLPPTNENAKTNSYVPRSKGERESNISDFLPPRPVETDDEDCEEDECVDITRSSFPDRESKSLSTTLPPSNKNAKVDTYVPKAKREEDEECVDEECVDITRTAFPDRETKSLSTTLPPSTENAKTNSYVPGSKRTDDEECLDDDCVDITRSNFPDRQTRSLSTTLPPSNGNAKTNSYVAGSNSSTASKADAQPEEYFDITTRLFQERGQSLSSGYQSVFRKEERSEMNSRASSLYAKVQSKTKSPPASGSSSSKSSDQNNKEDAYMDITQRLWDERQTPSLSTPPPSSFAEEEKSEMNDRKKTSSKATSRDVDEEKRPYSSLSQFVNPGAKRSSVDEDGGYVDESERFSDRSSFVQSVNSGTNKKGMTSGPAKEKTTSGSDKETEKRVYRPSPRNVDDIYQDITQNPFSSERSSFVQRVNSITSKESTATGSFREIKGRTESEEKKFFSSDRSSLMGARTWNNENVVVNNEHNKYLSDPASLRGARIWKNEAETVNKEHEKYLSSDRSSILGSPSIRKDIPANSEESNKYLSSDRSSLSGAPSIKRVGASDNYLDKNQFSSDLSPSSPVKASATNALWRNSSGESNIDTPPAFMKNLDLVASRSKKNVKNRRPSDDYLNKNTFSQTLAPSSTSQVATSASKSSNPFLNKNGFNDISKMRTSNSSGAQFKSSHDVSPEEKKLQDYFDITTAKLPDFVEMAGTSASGENATGSRSPKQQEKDDYTVVGNFDRLERATSAVKDANTISRSKSGGLSQNESEGEVSKTKAKKDNSDTEFEVMSWLLKNLPELDEEDAVSYFMSLLEDGFDSIEMLYEVLKEDLYFMKDEHQDILMKNLDGGEDGGEPSAFSKSLADTKKELEETSTWAAERTVEAADRHNTTDSAAEGDINGGGSAGEKKSSTNKGDDVDFTDITRANFGDRTSRPSLSAATPPLFEKDPSPESEEQPFAWQIDVRKDAEESLGAIPDSFPLDQPSSEAPKQLFQATPPVMMELNEDEGAAIKESTSVREKKRSTLGATPAMANPLFQATPPMIVELTEGMTAEEAELAREERMSGEANKSDDQTPTSRSSQISEGMTAEEAEAARSSRLSTTSKINSVDGPSVEEPKEMQQKESQNVLPPRDELYQHYIAKGFTTQQAQQLKDYYTTWTIGPSHEMKFTSVFTCPLTGEHFAAGLLRNEHNNGEVWSGQVWYKNKKQSMNAAAAKALDCFSFRSSKNDDDSNDSSSMIYRCDDEAYGEGEAPRLILPPNVVLPTELIQPNT